MLEAIAIRLETIASRLDAIAIRLEAIASRWETIAMNVDCEDLSFLGFAGSFFKAGQAEKAPSERSLGSIAGGGCQQWLLGLLQEECSARMPRVAWQPGKLRGSMRCGGHVSSLFGLGVNEGVLL